MVIEDRYSSCILILDLREFSDSVDLMDFFADQRNVFSFLSFILALIMDANDSLAVTAYCENDALQSSHDSPTTQHVHAPIMDCLSISAAALHNFRLCSSNYALPDEISYWVKPRSTTWFSRFLLEEYDDSRWLSIFRMTKGTVFSLADLLAPIVQKKDTRYRLAIPVLIRVACTLFKLTHGANLTLCSEMFAIGKSTVCKILREVVHAINDTLKHEVSWPCPEKLRRSQFKFKEMCSLLAVVGAIDGMHVAIAKTDFCPADYYYFKSGGYSMNCQAVVDADKRFIDLYIGMPGSTNDSRMLRRSHMHYLANHGNLMNPLASVDGFPPYLIGDLGYPLLPGLMVPHRGGRDLSVSESLFNKKLRAGRCVVENAFGILKHTFRELMLKSDLHLAFLPDVILACAILHNILLGQDPEQVENLLTVLRNEGLNNEEREDGPLPPEPLIASADENSNELGIRKRHDLGVFLSTRRR